MSSSLFILIMSKFYLSGRSEQEHPDNTEWVLKKMSEAGMCLKREKCLFCQNWIIWDIESQKEVSNQ